MCIRDRIRTLVENGVKKNERTMFVLVGDRGRDQIVNLHYMLSKAVVKSRPNVLWCYKKDLYLSSHKKKRAKQIKKMQNSGLMDAENEDPFSLFVASTDAKPSDGTPLPPVHPARPSNAYAAYPTNASETRRVTVRRRR